jgi:hypothetical protein
MGLQLLIPPASDPGRDLVALDAPVGQLYLHGALGATLGMVAAAALWHAMLGWLRGTDDLAAAAAVLEVFLWRGVPLLLAAVSALMVVRCGRRLGLVGSSVRAVLGGVWMVGLGVAVSGWMGDAAVFAACVFSPLAAARLGLGLFQPWWPLRRLVAVSALVVAMSALLVYARADDPPHSGRLEETGGAGPRAEGTGQRLGGSQPAVSER